MAIGSKRAKQLRKGCGNTLPPIINYGRISKMHTIKALIAANAVPWQKCVGVFVNIRLSGRHALLIGTAVKGQ